MKHSLNHYAQIYVKHFEIYFKINNLVTNNYAKAETVKKYKNYYTKIIC